MALGTLGMVILENKLWFCWKTRSDIWDSGSLKFRLNFNKTLELKPYKVGRNLSPSIQLDQYLNQDSIKISLKTHPLNFIANNINYNIILELSIE